MRYKDWLNEVIKKITQKHFISQINKIYDGEQLVVVLLSLSNGLWYKINPNELLEAFRVGYTVDEAVEKYSYALEWFIQRNGGNN